MLRNLLILLTLCTLIVGCSGAQVRELRTEVRDKQAELNRQNGWLQEIDEILDDPSLAGGDLWEQAKRAKPAVEAKIDEINAALTALKEDLENIEATEAPSIGNALQVFEAIATSVAPLLGPPGLTVLGVGGIAGAVGRHLGRKKGVDETLEVIESSDVPVTMTKNLENQQEILRKGNKAVASGVARLVAKQGNG